MTEGEMQSAGPARTPWHLWVVGIVSLLWNIVGSYRVVAAYAGTMPGLPPAEREYYAGHPGWLEAIVYVALATSSLGSLALLWRSRWALRWFLLSVGAIVVSDGYDLAAGTAYVLVDRGSLIVNSVIWCLALAQLAYAWAMTRRGALR